MRKVCPAMGGAPGDTRKSSRMPRSAPRSHWGARLRRRRSSDVRWQHAAQRLRHQDVHGQQGRMTSYFFFFFFAIRISASARFQLPPNRLPSLQTCYMCGIGAEREAHEREGARTRQPTCPKMTCVVAIPCPSPLSFPSRPTHPHPSIHQDLRCTVMLAGSMSPALVTAMSAGAKKYDWGLYSIVNKTVA